jgi:hypothetical protein
MKKTFKLMVQKRKFQTITGDGHPIHAGIFGKSILCGHVPIGPSLDEVMASLVKIGGFED